MVDKIMTDENISTIPEPEMPSKSSKEKKEKKASIEKDVVPIEEDISIKEREETVQKSVEPPTRRYRLSMYTSSGILRSDIMKNVFHVMNAKYGDLLRSIPHERFATVQEIEQIHRGNIRRLGIDHPRSVENIEDALTQLIDASLVEVR